MAEILRFIRESLQCGMCRRFAQVAQTCLLIILLGGCQEPMREPVSLNLLCGFVHQPDFSVGLTDEKGVDQWIKEKRGAVSRKEWWDTYGDLIVTYSWREGETYWFVVLRNGKLVRVSIEGVKQGVSVDQVVKGLGPPETLEAGLHWIGGCEHTCGYFIRLAYPELGVTVGSSRVVKTERLMHDGEYATTLSEDMSMTDLDCYVPGSMESVLSEAFQASPEGISTRTQRNKPWPGFGALVPLQ